MLTAIGDVMRECYARGWISTRDGNASVRRRGNSFFHITPSGVRKNKIEVEHLLKVKFSGGELVYDGNPSGELHMHKLLQSHDITRAVIHAHPTHVVAAIRSGINLQEISKEFPELSRYTKVARTVPLLPVTSVELGECTANNLSLDRLTGKVKYDIVGQVAHGVCAVAHNPWDAFEHIERLNHICEIVLLSEQ